MFSQEPKTFRFSLEPANRRHVLVPYRLECWTDPWREVRMYLRQSRSWSCKGRGAGQSVLMLSCTQRERESWNICRWHTAWWSRINTAGGSPVGLAGCQSGLQGDHNTHIRHEHAHHKQLYGFLLLWSLRKFPSLRFSFTAFLFLCLFSSQHGSLFYA